MTSTLNNDYPFSKRKAKLVFLHCFVIADDPMIYNVKLRQRIVGKRVRMIRKSNLRERIQEDSNLLESFRFADQQTRLHGDDGVAVVWRLARRDGNIHRWWLAWRLGLAEERTF